MNHEQIDEYLQYLDDEIQKKTEWLQAHLDSASRPLVKTERAQLEADKGQFLRILGDLPVERRERTRRAEDRRPGLKFEDSGYDWFMEWLDHEIVSREPAIRKDMTAEEATRAEAVHKVLDEVRDAFFEALLR